MKTVTPFEPAGLEHPEVERVARALDALLQSAVPEDEARRLRRHRRELAWIERVLVNTGHVSDAPASELRPAGKVEALALAGNEMRPVPIALAASGLLASIAASLVGVSPDV